MKTHIYSFYAEKTLEDLKAIEVFEKHRNEFDLDTGSLDYRFDEAERFTREYFEGTPYSVEVDEYCCNCTVTTLYKEE
jgi:hypothetical protein